MNGEELKEILIAEDDKDDFELLEDVIKSHPISIVVKRADNGEILMKIIHENIPDLLFLDLMLPCKDGKTCLLEIRSNKKFDELPIIVYSAQRDADSVEFCFRNGSNMYVYKPDTYSQIVDAVEKVFAFDWKKMTYYPTRSNFVLNPDA